ncbi:MAG: hypothetical protein QGG67_07785 [Gammaproteobacteria bacterium]|jgi:hypothetical protein|nr:hypothetical protein [Gammaproteobacteria bacterium]
MADPGNSKVVVPEPETGQLAHIEELDTGMLEFSGDRLIAGQLVPQ